MFSDACIFKEHARYHEPLGNQEIVYSPPIMNGWSHALSGLVMNLRLILHVSLEASVPI